MWTVYSLDDERNMKSLIQGFFDTFALLAVKYEFLTTTTTNKRIEDLDISRKTAGGVLLSMEQHRLLKLYFFIDDYLNSESETSSSENKNNASNYTDSSSEYCEAEIHDNLVLKVLLHSTLAFVVDKTSDCDFYMSILKKSTQAVIDTCLTVYVTAPTDVQALTTYGSSTVNSDGSYSGNQSNFELGYENERPTSYFNDMNTSSPSSSSSSSSSLLSSAHVKHSLLNSLLQLQTVINILRYLGVQSDSTNNTSIITGTHVKHTPLPTTTTTKTHSSSSNNNNLSFITTSIHNLQATEIDTQVYWWFSHLARILVPYQPMISLSIKMIVLLVSSSCRFDITTAVLKSSVSKSSPRSNHIASQELMELLQMNYLNITRVEAIQFLSASPKGTFLIRPHDSNPELYYLSFHSGESEAVKHAIIRKEIITATTPTASGTGTAGAGSIANTTTGALSGKIDSNDATKNRPRLDKSVSVQADEEENKETESGTVIGSATDSQRDSTSGDKVVSKVVFKCGKIGPCDTILDLIT